MNDGSKYAIGNGKIIAYCSNGNIEELFGPPYSSPSVFSLTTDTSDLSLQERVAKTAIWKNFSQNVTTVDLCHPDALCICRKITALEKTVYNLALHDRIRMDTVRYYDMTGVYTTHTFAALYHILPGNYIYNEYPLTLEQFFIITIDGRCTVNKYSTGNGQEITCEGECEIRFIGGNTLEEAENNYYMVRDQSFQEFYHHTESYWRDYFERQTVFKKLSGFYDEQDLSKIVESTIINIKNQQSAEGGVLAGHNYHLGYVRDQYGAYRCLLKLGCIDEARNILNFYNEIFRVNGYVLNAQGMGVKGLFHFAENDSV